ncbi:ATP-dependent (S)-NAD(P)H-hydrate dehydratase [Phycisphaerae bacterium RAS1]|nr:ATP-dependent (S)-NAD(P)H-hydrate dehydratase [Phycisphaerae bacterium RAS1]
MTLRWKTITSLPSLPARSATMHKGLAGHVAILAGSRGMSGAAVLCGLGALRGGAGLVRLYTPASVLPIVAAAEPCLMTAPLDEDSDGRIAPGALRQLAARRELDWAHVVAIGPGMGQNAGLAAALIELLAGIQTTRVIDADALNMLAAQPPEAWKPLRRSPTILTPHPGEMARLRAGLGLRPRKCASDDERAAAAGEFAKPTRSVCVLKGHHTVVSDGRRAFVNSSGNPGMAAGGMGDVLTGLIAALAGQGLDPFSAACLGVHVHGTAADVLADRIGPFGYLAREVAAELPSVLSRFAEG